MPAASQDPLKEAKDRLYGILRAIRAEAQNLLEVVGELQNTGKQGDSKVRQHEFHAELLSYKPIYEQNCSHITDLLKDARELFANNAAIYSRCADEVTHVENFVERASRAWPKGNETLEHALKTLAEIEQWWKKVVWHCGLVTIPARVREHLASLWVGQALDFKEQFEDELQDPKERAHLLHYLADHPSTIPGMVDEAHGVIYKASPNKSARLSSLVLIASTIVVIGPLLIWAVVRWGSLWHLDFEPRAFNLLLGGYIMIMFGSLANIIVHALKHQNESPNGFFSFSGRLLWLHVKQWSILMGVLSLWFGLAILTWLREGKVELTEAFFVGYAIDSFMDLFLQRFGKFVTTGTEALKKELELTVPKVAKA